MQCKEKKTEAISSNIICLFRKKTSDVKTFIYMIQMDSPVISTTQLLVRCRFIIELFFYVVNKDFHMTSNHDQFMLSVSKGFYYLQLCREQYSISFSWKDSGSSSTSDKISVASTYCMYIRGLHNLLLDFHSNIT